MKLNGRVLDHKHNQTSKLLLSFFFFRKRKLISSSILLLLTWGRPMKEEEWILDKYTHKHLLLHTFFQTTQFSFLLLLLLTRADPFIIHDAQTPLTWGSTHTKEEEWSQHISYSVVIASMSFRRSDYWSLGEICFWESVIFSIYLVWSLSLSLSRSLCVFFVSNVVCFLGPIIFSVVERRSFVV